MNHKYYDIYFVNYDPQEPMSYANTSNHKNKLPSYVRKCYQITPHDTHTFLLLSFCIVYSFSYKNHFHDVHHHGS